MQKSKETFAHHFHFDFTFYQSLTRNIFCKKDVLSLILQISQKILRVYIKHYRATVVHNYKNLFSFSFFRRSAVDHPSPSDSPTKHKNISSSDAEQLLTDAPGPSKVSSPEEYIQEVRKDSALYLEEEEGTPNILKPADTDVPRRQSSGYGGSFDDNNRRSSTTSGDNAQQQDLSPLLRERRRSRSKILKNLAGRVEESIDEKVSGTGISGESMPTTEIHRKVSGAGLDMPNIKEVKEVLREGTLVQQETVIEVVAGVGE